MLENVGATNGRHKIEVNFLIACAITNQITTIELASSAKLTLSKLFHNQNSCNSYHLVLMTDKKKNRAMKQNVVRTLSHRVAQFYATNIGCARIHFLCAANESMVSENRISHQNKMMSVTQVNFL